jgi:response regulator RpfG family c-di-GMP phosphodiesterase
MPEMNGIELIKNIRISERFREIPIIMVTGMMVSAENLKEAFEAGATDYLKKPFNKVELNARVKSVLLLTSAIKEVKLVHAEILEGKKRELVATSIKLVQMSELNSKLLDDLNSMIDDFSDETKEKIDSIISRYNLNSLDSTWKEFETRFGNVYEDFYEKLGRSHLGLTLNEKRLSALLKLGFNTKAIAALTFQEAKSVDMARYRLRKKLDLAPDVNLSEYLMNF